MNEAVICTFYVKTKDGTDVVYDCYAKEILYLSLSSLMDRTANSNKTTFENNQYKVVVDFATYYDLLIESKGMICESLLFKIFMIIFKKYLVDNEA